MNTAALIKLGVFGAALFAAYKWAPSPVIKTAVLGVVGVAVLKNAPVVNQYVPL